MDTLILKNLIAGKETSGGNTFTVNSDFYERFNTRVEDATIFDIKMATSKAKAIAKECNQIPFEDRKKILNTAAKKIRFSTEDLEYIVQYTGMPIAQVKKNIEEIKITLQIIPELVEKRIGIKHGKIDRKPLIGANFFKVLNSINGFVSAVTQAND